MKVISLVYNEKNNASSKAPSDIDKILIKNYNAKTKQFIMTKNYRLKYLFYILANVFSKDILVIQTPIFLRNKLYDIISKKRTILFIHDISGLRFLKKDILTKEISIYKKFKYIIVHNNSMKDFLVSKGVNKNNLYVLEIFDYLIQKPNRERKEFNKEDIEIIYPGNLKKEKSLFLYKLDENKMKYKINMYGLGINDNITNKKITYKGAFNSDTTNFLEGDIGLVWDGDIDESDEQLDFKNYMKYNNPHKISCLLALGLPVIVWKKSAISEFVKKNNVGYLINNLYDINNLDFYNYEEKRENATIIGNSIRNGYYTTKVFNEIINKINNN